MSGRPPRQKGNRLERELVKLLEAAGIPAKRVPLSGSAKGYPGDVCATLAGRELCLECKSRKDFKTLYKWLEHRDALILKADRKEPLMVLRLTDFLKAAGNEVA
jgi:Holliday junction resolvase